MMTALAATVFNSPPNMYVTCTCSLSGTTATMVAPACIRSLYLACRISANFLLMAPSPPGHV